MIATKSVTRIYVLTCIARMAGGPRTWGVPGIRVCTCNINIIYIILYIYIYIEYNIYYIIRVCTGSGRHQGRVQLVVTRTGEASARWGSKSWNISVRFQNDISLFSNWNASICFPWHDSKYLNFGAANSLRSNRPLSLGMGMNNFTNVAFRTPAPSPPSVWD